MESSYRRTAIDTAINGAATVLMTLIGLVQLPLMSKTLGATGYGLWSQVMATVSLILPFASLGIAVSLSRFLASETDRNKIATGFYTAVSTKMVISLAVALAVFFSAPLLSGYFFDGHTDLVRLTSAIILVAGLEPVYMRLLRIFRQITRHALIQLVSNLSFIILLVVVLLSGYDIYAVALSYLGVRLALIAVLFFTVRSRIGMVRPSLAVSKKYLKYGLPTVPQSLGFWLVNLTDRYIIAYFHAFVNVGYYSAAYTLGSLPSQISGLLNFILLVALSKLYDEKKIEEVRVHLSYSIKYFLTLVIPFICGATLLGVPVLTIFSNRTMGEAGRWIVPIIALSFLFLGLQTIISKILLLVNKPKILAWTWLLAAALNFGLNLVVIPAWGIIGAAVTTLLAYFVAVVIIGYYARKEIPLQVDWLFIVKSLVASGFMSLAVWWMNPQLTWDTLLTVAVGVIVYAAVLILLRGFTSREWAFFRSLIKRGSGRGTPQEFPDSQ